MHKNVKQPESHVASYIMLSCEILLAAKLYKLVGRHLFFTGLQKKPKRPSKAEMRNRGSTLKFTNYRFTGEFVFQLPYTIACL